MEILWALIGLVLTIGATWLEAFITSAPWQWGTAGIQIYSLEVSFQVGAVLLTGCLGGKNAAALAQIAYVALGVVLFHLFGLLLFTQGGGLGYVREPSFGYLLGFIPGGWLCGQLAFREPPKLEELAYSSLAGLAVIHGCGLVYLAIAALGQWLAVTSSLGELVWIYTVAPLPGQLIMVCAVAVVAFILRRVLFY